MARGAIIRTVLFAGLAAAFAFLAWQLYERQKARYTYLSFEVPDAELSVLVTDCDRLLDKYRMNPELDLAEMPELLLAGIAQFASNPGFQFNEAVSNGLFYSQNAEGFSLVIENRDLSVNDLADLLKDNFNLVCSTSDGELIVGEDKYSVRQFNQYCCISNVGFSPSDVVPDLEAGNTDYITFSGTGPINDKASPPVHHILSGANHFRLCESEVLNFSGAPVPHRPFFEKVPADFDEIQFYGSTRLQLDAEKICNAGKPELFSWMDGGFLILQRGTFCLILAPQNDQRDLRLILEEETTTLRPDSVINLFNIGNHEVMPFETKLSWKSCISSLTDDMHFYTEFDNFNIMSNCIPALRWYLTELQTGNFFMKDDKLKWYWTNALPMAANHISIGNGKNGMDFLAIVSQSDKEISTSLLAGVEKTGDKQGSNVVEFPVAILPTSIQQFKSGTDQSWLLSNKNAIAVYSSKGELKWMCDMTSEQVQNPLVIDLENDGSSELAVFLTDQFLVLSNSGKFAPGFPVKLDEVGNGGIAVNYDNLNDFRFFVNSGKNIICLDESGKIVEGWTFKGMADKLSPPIIYDQIGGKDFIVMRDHQKKYYRLNRRGENRYEKMIEGSIFNNGDFLVGTNEENVHLLDVRGQYLVKLYLKDGSYDSVKIDESVKVESVRWIREDRRPLLVVEEASRVLTIDEFGFTQNEVLKADAGQRLVSVYGSDMLHVFTDNSQNNLYLRDKGGKLLFSGPVKGSSVLTIANDQLATLSGNMLKVYKLN